MVSRSIADVDVLRQDIKNRVDGATDVTRAKTGDDHGSQTGLGAQGSDEGRRYCPKRAKAEDGGDRVTVIRREFIVQEH